MTVRDGVGLVVAIVVCFAAAGIGSLATVDAIPTWYATLRRPSWNPPNWVFGPVWSLLYLMMAVAAWQVWRTAGWQGARLALGLFAFQLLLNVGWSVVFFGLHRPGWAFVEIVVLWCAILATLLLFRPISSVAALLLAPYLLWVSFAGALNLAIWRLN
ncbi:MAG: tryptophan-rich sensory protein [Gemmatimonadales bacterium]|nr:MAG: tryptophan-rich sensory protein [Gemmatimonadales bacterium]